MKRASKTEFITFRVEPEIHDRIVEAAARDRRSISNLAAIIVSDWLNEHAAPVVARDAA